jgi:hypothetical protein
MEPVDIADRGMSLWLADSKSWAIVTPPLSRKACSADIPSKPLPERITAMRGRFRDGISELRKSVTTFDQPICVDLGWISNCPSAKVTS